MGSTDVETMTNVTIGKYDFDDEAFQTVSKESLDFISKLLVKDLRWEHFMFMYAWNDFGVYDDDDTQINIEYTAPYVRIFRQSQSTISMIFAFFCFCFVSFFITFNFK